MKTWENSNNRLDAIFVSTEDRFSSGKSLRGLSWLKSQDVKGSSFKCTSNYIYEDIDDFNKFKNSKILVVGGGPSSIDVTLQLEDYDYIFSCNHFFKSEKFKDVNLDVLFIGNEVDTFSSSFVEYCKKSSTYLAVEDLEWRPKHRLNLLNNFREKAFLCSSRYQSKLTGAASKMCMFALELGAKQLDFIGIDGVPPDYNQKELMPHGFQDKKLFRKTNEPYTKIIEHYKHFDAYIRYVYPDCNINNLGRFCKCNYAHEKQR
jgi:hypothetical protein